jgi:drug/metabolite transporter (DMT)-like permease
MTTDRLPGRSVGARLWASPYLLLTITALFWAGNTVTGRAARADVPPIALSLARWWIALAIVMPFAWRRIIEDRAALLAAWKPILVLSVFGIAAYNAFQYTGLKTTTAINAGLLGAAMSPFVLGYAFVFFRERPSRRVIVGTLASTLGAVVVVSQGSLATLMNFHFNPGDAWLMAGIAAYALYTVWLREAPKVHPLSLLAVTFAIGGVLLIPFGVAEAASGQVLRPGPVAWGSIAYVAVFPSLLAYLMFNRGVELIGSGRASQFIYLIPVFASLLAVVLLGERLHLYHLAGALLIGLGIVIASRKGRRP